MKPVNKLAESEMRANSPAETAIDPFAVDFFGIKVSPNDENHKTRENFFNPKRLKLIEKKSDWFKKLPQISQTEAEFSIAIKSLPENLTTEITKIISKMLARYTFRQPEKVSCSIISIAEENINDSLNLLAKSPQIFFSVTSVTNNSMAMLTLNTEFASSVIDIILGSQNAENPNQRILSPIETTITEFLVVSILSEINNFFGQPILTLQSIEIEPTQHFASEERGAEIVFLIEIDGFSGILTAFLPRKFLAQFENSESKLFVNKEKKRLNDFEKFIPWVDLNIQIGATYLDADSLSFLESDDIVLVEKSEITLDKGLLGNNLQISVGRGRSFRLQGNADTKEFNGEMFFQIKEIFSEETQRKFKPIKLKMEEKEITTEIDLENDENLNSQDELVDEQISQSLENVQVALRVQLAADKITLRDVQNLHKGQLIALGCRPNDPVRLVTDNNEEPIALGELVEIEGQLGVRLTKVFI